MANVLLIIDELFLKTKVSTIVEHLGHAWTSYNSGQSLEEYDHIILDLQHPEAQDILHRQAKKCLAFGPHVNEEALRDAKALGCKEALPRNMFFNRLPELIK